MSGHMVFSVEVTELAGGWRVHIDAGDAGECQIVAPRLALALEVVRGFAVGVLDPEPPPTFGERLLRAGLAVDGPPDMGGGS